LTFISLAVNVAAHLQKLGCGDGLPTRGRHTIATSAANSLTDSMKLSREWATPLTIGTFVLMAVTGILMFFHLDRGMNKVAHEWLGWAMVIAVVLHVVVNFPAFRRHLYFTTARVLIGVFVLILALSFFHNPFAGKNNNPEPAFAAPVHALARAPLSTLAQVSGLSSEALMARLKTLGVAATSEQQSLQDLVGTNLHRQIDVLSSVIPTPQP
jgi:hypothetical protein